MSPSGHGRRRRRPMDAAATFLVPPSLHVAALRLGEDGVTIRASSEAVGVRCPVCGEPSGRGHSRYERTLAERLAGIVPAARRTDRPRERLTDLALVLGGEEGSRLAANLGMPVRPDTRLRLIRGAPERERPTPAVLGVDDWAIPKGLTSGTILV